MIYIFAVLLAICQCYYQKHQFNDLKFDRDIRWKHWRIVTTFVIFVTLFLSQFFTIFATDILLASSIYWIAFELGTNKISLNTDWFYVGRSSFTDNKLGKYKWILMAVYLVVSLFLKYIL